MKRISRINAYIICMFADELDFYYRVIHDGKRSWSTLGKSTRHRIFRKAIENGYTFENEK